MSYHFFPTGTRIATSNGLALLLLTSGLMRESWLQFQDTDSFSQNHSYFRAKRKLPAIWTKRTAQSSLTSNHNTAPMQSNDHHQKHFCFKSLQEEKETAIADTCFTLQIQQKTQTDTDSYGILRPIYIFGWFFVYLLSPAVNLIHCSEVRKSLYLCNI